jgi:hypothetical protein
VKATEVIIAHGHENIRSTNRTTFEVTKETHLTKKGNCIIAVDATKGAADVSQQFKNVVCSDNAQIIIELEVDGEKETVKACGSSRLTLTHPTDLVIRKSNFVCNRTLAIKADKTASKFSRKIVEKLQNPNQKVKITLTAESVT